MKTKWLVVVVVLTALISSSGFSATLGTWYGAPAGDTNHPASRPAGTGSWKDAYWNGPNNPGIHLPAGPATAKDEIKLVRAKTVCTLDSNAGNYICKLSIAGGPSDSNSPRLEIAAGGALGIGEFRVGCGGSTMSGGIGHVNQTGGTVNLADNLMVGRYGTSTTNPNNGKGFYTISGGTITCLSTNTKGCLYVGGAGGMGPSEGTFTIAGNAANVSFKKLYVGSDGVNTSATGTLEFKIGSTGVSPIRLSDEINIDAKGAASTAKLIVSATAEPPKANILLAENQGSGLVNGIFDTVNGNPAPEGAPVVLSFGGNNYNYTLTYKGGSGNNDIILLYAPAPATTAAPAAPAPPVSAPNTTAK